VDRPRNQFFPGPCLSADEHGRVGQRNLLDLAEHFQKRRAVADDLFEVVLGANLVLEVDFSFSSLAFKVEISS